MYQDKDKRFKNLEVKLGVMVLLAIAGIVVVIVLLGIERDIFTKKYRLRFVTESGSGFVEGMPVKLSGFKIGRVKSTELTEGASVLVVIEINKRYQKWIRSDSRVHLAKEGYIGESYIEVTTGHPEARALENNEQIAFEKTGGIEELVNEAKPILNEVKDIIHYVNDPQGDIKQTLGNLRGLSSELRTTRRGVDDTLGDTRGLVRDVRTLVDNASRSIPQTIDSANRAVKNIEGITVRLEPTMARIEKITENAETASQRLPATLEKVDKIVDNVKNLTDTLSAQTPRLRQILMDADDTLRDTKSVVRGVKQSWPVKLMVPPVKEPELVPLDASGLGRSGVNGRN